jgi:hypothetical protein
MKKPIIFLFALMLSASAFAFQSDFYQDKNTAKTDSIAIAPGDTTEYELIVLDPGFNNWFLTNRKPIWYHEKEYYHSKNTFYTTNWNIRVLDNMHRPPYEFEIDYDQSIDYGVELEWQLFWYFKYMEQKYNIRIGP